MKIVFKHILKNIWEKKGRSLLIVLSLIIATSVFVLNLTLPDEISLKMQETLRSIYGEAEIEVSTVEPFTIKDLKKTDEKINYVGFSSAEVSVKNEQTQIIGVDIKNAQNMNMLGEDVPELKKNEIVINSKKAETFSYKEGEKIKAIFEEKEYELKIAKIVSKKGLTTLDVEYPVFIANLDTVNEMKKIEKGKYEGLFIDVKNNENVKQYSDYLKENNKDFIIQHLVDADAIAEQLSFISYVMILVFVLATIMIFFVVNSLNKIIIAERLPIIGTFRSVGATRGKMNFILILENAVYGLIGGTIGTFIGYTVNSKAASLFIVAEGVELSKASTKMSISGMLIGIAFAVLLEIFISIKTIIKANKKPIKDLIFDVQSTRYRIRNYKIIMGIIMFSMALIINFLNTKAILPVTIIAIILLMVGVANLVPLIMRGFSKLLATISKKLNFATGVIASKNIGYNKMIISSAKLIIVSIPLVLSILMISSSFTKIMEAFKYTVDDYNIVIERVSKSSKEYDKISKIEGIEKVNYMFAFFDEDTTYNDGKKFKAVPVLLGAENSRKYIKELDYKIKDLKEKDYKERLDEILKIIGLENKRNSLPSQLSGGQQQRVSIARAIILNPAIILADEPIGNLDSKSGKEIMELFKKINKEEKITILQVTHSEESAQYGNRIIRLKDGKII